MCGFCVLTLIEELCVKCYTTVKNLTITPLSFHMYNVLRPASYHDWVDTWVVAWLSCPWSGIHECVIIMICYFVISDLEGTYTGICISNQSANFVWFRYLDVYEIYAEVETSDSKWQSWLKSDLSLALVYWYVARVRSDFEETPLGFTCRWPKIVTLANQSNSYFRGYESNKDMQRRISGNGINIHGSFRFPRIYRKSSRKQTRGNSVKQLKKTLYKFYCL